MALVITDKNRVEEVLSRGVERVYPSRDFLEKELLSGKRLRLYCGFDPSAAALHIGNAIALNKLSQFQDLGHEVIFLIGDFTGMIGDPTDKGAARRKLSRKEVLANAKNYKKQAGAWLRFSGQNSAKVLHNSRWNDKVSFTDLIELASNFTVQQMIQRDMFQERLKEEKPIYLHEFLYPLTQGYDSVAMDVDLEIGGNDQMFNMLCGRDLLKAIKNKEKSVLTLKLLADENGKKMGKSEGNVVYLDANHNDMYGQIMSWPDGVLASAFELCTRLPRLEIEAIIHDLKKEGINPRDHKMRLALEITTICHGKKLAQEAQENFIRTIQKKEAPLEVDERRLGVDSLDILTLLVETELAPSKSEARRLVGQGGIKVDNELVSDPKHEVSLDKGVLVQRGKFKYLRVSK